jgi:hypothetical protein
VSTQVAPAMPRIAGELRKLAAFVRRDFLVAWSYRLAFFTDWGGLAIQMVTFYFLGQIISPSSLPTYGGEQVSYVEYVSVGVALTSFMYVALAQVVQALRT